MAGNSQSASTYRLSLRLVQVAKISGEFKFVVEFEIQGREGFTGYIRVPVDLDRKFGRGRHRKQSPRFDEIVSAAEKKVTLEIPQVRQAQ